MHIVSAVLDMYIPSMTFTRHRWTSRRRAPLWVFLLGARQPRVAAATNMHDGLAGIRIEDVAHPARHRWKRSLRAPVVLRLCLRLGIRRDTTDRAGQPA